MESQFMPSENFASLGGGEVAYVKPMTSEAFAMAFPNVADLAPGLSLWALLNADGTPIMVADSRDAAVQNAWENDLRTVSLH
ncbi:MAG: DUF1150 family protein [Alphaproteobacteria bacterium]